MGEFHDIVVLKNVNCSRAFFACTDSVCLVQKHENYSSTSLISTEEKLLQTEIVDYPSENLVIVSNTAMQQPWEYGICGYRKRRKMTGAMTISLSYYSTTGRQTYCDTTYAHGTDGTHCHIHNHNTTNAVSNTTVDVRTNCSTSFTDSGMSAKHLLFRKLLTLNQKRLHLQQWTERHRWTSEWRNIMFSYESCFWLQYHDGRIKVWWHHV